MTKIAFLGIGLMGDPMARNLVAAKHGVTVWNRTHAKADAIVGATLADTPATAVAGADVIISMLSDGDSTRATQSDPALRVALQQGQIWIEMASIKPAEARAQGG